MLLQLMEATWGWLLYHIKEEIYIYIYIFDIIESEKFQSIIRSHVLRSRFHYIYSVTNRKFPSVIE